MTLTSSRAQTTTVEPRIRKAGRARRGWRRSRNAYLLLLPGIALYGYFVLQPTVNLFELSFYSWDGLAPPHWLGLGNFHTLFSDPLFWQALRNNFLFMALLVAFDLGVGLPTAAVLARAARGRVIFQLIYFLPVVQASVVTALVWEWMYNPNGMVNNLLSVVGLQDVTRGWLGDPTFALPALALAAGWSGFGLSVVILLAGIQGIDPALYDAARVDGASTKNVFLHITIPQLRPVITVVLLLEMITGFQTFDIIWATTKGGPFESTEVLSTYMFKQGFINSQFGYGAAVAVAFMVIVLIAAGISLALRSRNEV